jgi:ABC-type bacteriocin/lantibiotic exporter with double-glycine peptidase domain
VPVRSLLLPHIKQTTVDTCTPACVRMVLAYYGVEMQEDELARLFGTQPGGGTVLSQLRLLAPFGFDVTEGKATFDDLRRAVNSGSPVITPVLAEHLGTYGQGECGGHCVVLTGVSKREVAIYDPQRDNAPDEIPLPRFQLAWQLRRCRRAVLRPR